MKNPKIFFWFIIILTIISILIIFPKTLAISFETPKIPLLNKSISVHKTLIGLNPSKLGIQRDLKFEKGLDLQGGTSITLRADMKGVPSDQKDSALDSAKTVIEKRVNFFGLSEPVIQTSKVNNDYRIIVELPGVTDVNQAVELIGKTAQLTFWEQGASASAKLATPSASTLPIGITQFLGPNPHKTNLTGKDLQNATVTFDRNSGAPQVQIVFTPDGTKKFADITSRNVGKPLAIVLDNQLVDYPPRVNEAILNGTAVITGQFTSDQAKSLAVQLNAGALPVSLSVLQQNTVGATLGEASLQKSLFAGILGFLVVVIFMVVLYGRLGIIASFALVLYSLYVLSIFKLIPVTLTLAGIAGFILSIGMAVDANILIFERMKEELRRGKPQDIALELGFSRAWTSIRDSNIASLITSFILFQFGTGIVKGFALTLAIGVLVSMFSAIVVTRTFLRLTYRNRV